MGKKCLNIISYQFFHEKYFDEGKLKNITQSEKKIVELIDSNPSLKEFFHKFDKRERKYFLNFIKIIEINPEVNNFKHYKFFKRIKNRIL